MGVVTYAAAQLLRVLPRGAISRAMGTLSAAKPPQPLMQRVLDVYCRAYEVDLAAARPSDTPYESFDAFFTRRLRDGLRPIEGDDRTLVSPADGKLSVCGRVEPNGTFIVKGQPYTMDELLEDSAFARELQGGGFGVVYLAPRDYHRVHSPVAGKIVRVRAIAGDRYPVNRIGELHVPQLFIRNRRVLVEIESPVWGRCAVVLVGAMIVGRMTVVGIDQPDVEGEHVVSRSVARGDEIGAFHLGSTVVFAVPKKHFDSFGRAPGEVFYGQALTVAKTSNGANGKNGARA